MPRSKAVVKDPLEEKEEDIFDRFTDLKTKKRQREKLEKRVKAKRKKLVEYGKEYARDRFNSAPSEETLAEWRKVWSRPDEPKAEDDLKTIVVEPPELPEVPSIGDEVVGLQELYKYIEYAQRVRAWESGLARRLGWRANTTGYDPVPVSASCVEMRGAALECGLMMVKQTSWMLRQGK